VIWNGWTLPNVNHSRFFLCNMHTPVCLTPTSTSLPGSHLQPLSQRDRVTSFPRRPCDLVPSFPMETMGTRFKVIICSFIFRYLTFVSSTGLLFIFSMVAMIFFFKYFTHDAQCRTNLYFVSFSLCQCVAATVISVLPKVQEAQSGTGK